MIVALSFLTATMSSGVVTMSRKRTHSLEQGGERAGSDVNTKKPRVSSKGSTGRKKKRKRTVPVVEDIAGSSSTRSHDDGAGPMSAEVQHRGGRRGKPRRVAESDEEDNGSTPHSQMTQKVCYTWLVLTCQC